MLKAVDVKRTGILRYAQNDKKNDWEREKLFHVKTFDFGSAVFEPEFLKGFYFVGV